MAINKVIYGNRTLIDLTGDTVQEADVMAGKTFHKADGTTGTGTKTANYQQKTGRAIKGQSVVIEPDSNYDALEQVVISPIAYLETENTTGITATIGANDGGGSQFFSLNSYATKALSDIASGDIEIEGTPIQPYRFAESDITKANMPDAVSIGKRAFMDSTSLTEALMPNATTLSNDCFNGCTNLTNASVKTGASLGGSAFKGCSSLEAVENLENAIYIGYGTCQNCSSLDVDEIRATTLDSYSFNNSGITGTLTIKNNATIKYYAFAGCENLEELICEGTPTINNSAFVGAGLKTVRLQNTSYLGATSFTGCSSLTDIYVPWSEGFIPNAPWGATNATVHYNTV